MSGSMSLQPEQFGAENRAIRQSLGPQRPRMSASEYYAAERSYRDEEGPIHLQDERFEKDRSR